MARKQWGAWSWTLTFTGIVIAFGYAYHDYTAATVFQTDDYLWRLWARLESNPWRAFCEDLAAGQAFRPLRYLSWYGLEQLIPHIPAIAPVTVLGAFLFYGCCAGLLAWQMTQDRWVGLITAALSLLCPMLGRQPLMWYSVLEDLAPPAAMLLASSFVVLGRRTDRAWCLAPALVAATIAGLWKEIALLMPALACAVLLTARRVPADGEAPQIDTTSTNRTNRLFCTAGPMQRFFSQWNWWVPFVCVVMLLLGWRFTVLGGSGLIGHHGLHRVEFPSKVEQSLNVAGLVGSTPVGLFYGSAVERSFPISARPTSAAWSLSDQLICSLVLSLAWLVWLWIAKDKRLLIAAGLFYLISWLPALTLTVVQPSYLYLPAFAICLLLSALLRSITQQPILCASSSIFVAFCLSVGTARYYVSALPVARDLRRETDSLLDMVRQEGEHVPQGTRVVLLGSHVMRPDIIAELDAVYRGERCKFDLYNFAAPVELIAPAVPIDAQAWGPLEISTEGLRGGHISMAGREFYFVELRSSVYQLADPKLSFRFWTPLPSGWHDISGAIAR